MMSMQAMLVVVLATSAAVFTLLPSPALSQLSTDFYDSSCPTVFSIIQSEVENAVATEARMGASLIRLFFHDCFVDGCDASILLDDTTTFTGEKTAAPNNNSVRGYDVIQRIKMLVDEECGQGVVSCADIVAAAARDSVGELGGPSYEIPVGRRDSLTANFSGANADLPGFFEDLPSLIQKFAVKGFTAREMVVLSGAHTVGSARCVTFRDRIYNESNIDPVYAASLRTSCPRPAGPPGDDNLAPLERPTPDTFDNTYFTELMASRGLLHSDQVLFNNGSTDADVTTYSSDADVFDNDFANAMIRMGNISPLTGTQGQIRNNCSRVN